MRLSALKALLTGCLLWGLSTFATAKPIEVKSENFIFYGDVSESSALSLIKGLEEYRSVIMALVQMEPGPEAVPIRIYGVKKPEDVTDITGSVGAAGVYITTLEGPVFVLSSQGGFRRGKQAMAIALHEYTHHLIANYTNRIYPRWYNEGIADYLSTFSMNKKGEVTIGFPLEMRAYALSQKNWIPMDTFVSAVRNYPFPNDGSRAADNVRSLFYGQSWLAVHYLQSTPAMNAKFNQYLNMINTFDTPVDAFETSFGMTPNDFGEALRDHFKDNRFLTSKITLKDDHTVDDPLVRKMTKSEMNFHKGEAARMFSLSRDRTEQALEFLEKASEEPGLSDRIQASKAMIAIQKQEWDQAIEYGRAAAEAPQAGSFALTSYANALLQKARDADVGRAPLDEARSVLTRALRQNPDNVYAHYLYATSFDIRRDPLTPQALESAKSALSYYRAEQFMGTNLELASVLVNAGEYGPVRPVLARIAAWGPTPGVRQFANRTLRELPGP